jgi:hypothetical protein
LAERHARHACKKKGKKDSWQEKQWAKTHMHRRKARKASMQEDLTRLGFWKKNVMTDEPRIDINRHLGGLGEVVGCCELLA